SAVPGARPERSAQNHGTDVRAGDEDAFVAGRVPPRSGHAPGPWRAVRGCGSWPRVAAACRTRRTATGVRCRKGRAGRVVAAGRGAGSWRRVVVPGRGAGSWCRIVAPGRGGPGRGRDP